MGNVKFTNEQIYGKDSAKAELEKEEKVGVVNCESKEKIALFLKRTHESIEKLKECLNDENFILAYANARDVNRNIYEILMIEAVERESNSIKLLGN